MIQLLGTWLGLGKQVDLLPLPKINFQCFDPLQLGAVPAFGLATWWGEIGQNCIYFVVRQFPKKEKPEGTTE